MEVTEQANLDETLARIELLKAQAEKLKAEAEHIRFSVGKAYNTS